MKNQNELYEAVIKKLVDTLEMHHEELSDPTDRENLLVGVAEPISIAVNADWMGRDNLSRAMGEISGDDPKTIAEAIVESLLGMRLV